MISLAGLLAMKNARGVELQIEGQNRDEAYQPEDNIIGPIDAQLKENPFKLTSADFRDLTRPSLGDSICYALAGGFLVMVAQILAKMWSGTTIAAWEPYAALVLLVCAMGFKFLGAYFLDRDLRQIHREMEDHFEKQRVYVRGQKERLDQYDN